MIGCFNHRVVTLVADKLRRQWYWDVYFQKYDDFCGDSLTDVQWLLYLQDNALVIGCSLIQTGVTPSQMFSGY